MTNDVSVSSHARLRWLQRVSAEEDYPAGAIRRAFHRGVDFTMGALDAVADEHTETVLVCHKYESRPDIVVTVLSDAVRQSSRGEAK